MQFEYEITANDYLDATLLYWKLKFGHKQVRRAAFWILVGVFFILVGSRTDCDLAAGVLLAALGAWWIVCGLRIIFPQSYIYRAYRKADLAGRKFKADINEEGFAVTGEYEAWRIQWPGVRIKGENEHLFVFYPGGGTLFIFGKMYLSSEQQSELRRMSGLAASTG
jgi:hypothetical protein